MTKKKRLFIKFVTLSNFLKYVFSLNRVEKPTFVYRKKIFNLYKKHKAWTRKTDMQKFVQFTTYDSFPLSVQVYNALHQLTSSYTAPKGFVFYDYFCDLYSKQCVVYNRFEKDTIRFEIYESHGGPLIATHVATYLRWISESKESF